MNAGSGKCIDCYESTGKLKWLEPYWNGRCETCHQKHMVKTKNRNPVKEWKRELCETCRVARRPDWDDPDRCHERGCVVTGAMFSPFVLV